MAGDANSNGAETGTSPFTITSTGGQGTVAVNGTVWSLISAWPAYGNITLENVKIDAPNVNAVSGVFNIDVCDSAANGQVASTGKIFGDAVEARRAPYARDSLRLWKRIPS